jgi:hypothetical protein
MPLFSMAQSTSIDHWETVVFETNNWHYFLGTTAPPTNWKEPTYSPTTWQVGQGGIGYDDGDDNTIIPPTLSLYKRLNFSITDTATILSAILHADYDDAFVAYLNGHEIARSNIGTVGIEPSYTEAAITGREAVMYQGQNPESYIVTKNNLSQYLQLGANTLAIQVHNVNSTSSDLSSRFFFSVGVNNTSMTYSPVPSWFAASFVGYNLPLIKIQTNGQAILEEVKITADMQVIDNGPGNLNFLTDAPNGYNGKIGIEIRGASSLMFEKKGYGFETRDSSGGNNNVSLLGMPSENDWVLHGPYSDKTLIRNYLTYRIAGRLGRYNPRVELCEMFLNDQYVGVYLLVEKIKQDKDRVDIAKLTPSDTLGNDLTGGYIFKIDRDMGPQNGWFSPYGYGYYAYHHPNGDDLHQKQKDYISNHFNSFESMMNTSTYNNPITGYRVWLDVPSFIDYMMMQEITRNIDAYRLSAFMYKEKDSKGGKIYGGPSWDFNLGYGNEDFCDGGEFDGWAFNYRYVCGAPFPTWWAKLVGDSQFRDDFHCRWDELRVDVLHTDTILNFIDSVVLEIEDARIRNFNRWNTIGTYVWPNAYIGATYEDEVNYLKNWITLRLGWMDNHMIGSNANCVTPTNEQSLKQNIAKVYPNPFNDLLSFESNSNEPITIHLYDALGRMTETVHLSPFNAFYQMNTKHLTAGMYFYTVYENGKLLANGKVLKD